MVRFDLISLLAAVSFFLSIILFREKILTFIDFCHFLLIVEGTIFLAGAITSDRASNQIIYDLEDPVEVEFAERNPTNSQARFNPVRYTLGLIFFCLGSFLGKI